MSPRTDPQSTVPVEPLSQLELDAVRKDLDPDDVHQYGGWAHLVARLLATLDAARASQPITATDLDALRFINYLWTATGRDPNVHVCDLFDKGDPIFDDIERFGVAFRAALPVREDEPTGIDAARRALAITFSAVSEARTALDDALFEYDRLTREASHVR